MFWYNLYVIGSDKMAEDGFGVVKKIFHNKEIVEYNSNISLMNELELLKGKVNALKGVVSECSSNILATYEQASEAIINDEISLSLDKLNDYNNELKKVEDALQQANTEISNKFNELQSRNSYLLGIING